MNNSSSSPIHKLILGIVLLGAGLSAFGLGTVQAAPSNPRAVPAAFISQQQPLQGITALAAGYDFTYALTSSGGVKCWGDVSLRVDGNITDKDIPMDAPGLTSGVTAITAGSQHVCALTSGGGVKCWGLNADGQLGDGTTESAYTPVDVSGLTSGVAAIAAGSTHTCVLTSGGGVKCWGSNDYGQLGDGTTTDRSTPVDVSGFDSGVTAIAAGNNFTCALTNTGGVKCWGSNTSGQLGDGTNEDSLTPVDVNGLRGGVTAIAAGDIHACALTNAGGLKCWGNNAAGQLGGDKRYINPVPVEVSGLTSGVTAIAAGSSHTCALTGGGVKCWGRNSRGQLGDGTTTNRQAPVDVSDLTSGVTALAAGHAHTCAVTDGGVKCWGWNSVGQLGDGTRTDSNTPVDVAAGETPAAVPAGFRPPGPLVPELTTYIPTPLDVSTSPTVIGTNLLLAALATILFTIASEMLNNTLAENEATLQGILRPARWIGRGQQRLGAVLSKRLGHPALLDATKLAVIVLFYGLVFSLLERGWNPLTLTGFYLFISMTIAFGVVGIADDIAQWGAARRWGVPTSLSLRPSNLLLAVASTTFSRILAFVPGIMFGTPEAFEVDKASLDKQKENNLLKIALGTLLIISTGVWLLTALTALVQRATLPELLLILVGGIESLLLLVFAVAVQNIFVQMLAFPGSIGRALVRWNRWLWATGLLAITFLFYHTLINPQGDLAAALSSANVRVFLTTVAVFVAGTLAVWLYFKWHNRRRAKPAALPTLVSGMPTAQPPIEIPPHPAHIPPILEVHTPVSQPQPEIHSPAIALHQATEGTIRTSAETKKCPSCAEEIKAEARICRHCRARFEVVVKGYCLNCHAVVEVDESDRCQQCNHQVADRHIESTLLKGAPV